MLRILLLATMTALPAVAAPPPDDGDPPASVAVLSWGLAEIAADLDLPMTGVTDPQGYATWVGIPALPAGSTDLGLRTEPNLEALTRLSPDLILGGDQQADMAGRLEAIAPTLIVDQFSAAHNNAAKARAIYLEIARLFGKADRAEGRLAQIDAAMKDAGDRVRAAWGGAPPPILAVRLLSATSVRIHGSNSLPTAALRGMGLAPAARGRATEWGFTLAPVEALAEYPDAAIVHFDPFPAADELYDTSLWAAIPAVAAGRFATAEPAWTFGSAVSLEILARRIADALVSMAPA